MFPLERRCEVIRADWEWPMKACQENHQERVALLRPIPYELTKAEDGPLMSDYKGRALSLNISSGGMLVLMEEAPDISQVLKVYVPTPVTVAETPTLAEVRWARRVPFEKETREGPYLVGLKFIF